MRISTPSRSATRAGVADRADVEADDDRVGRGGEHDVGLVDAADAAVEDVDRDLVLRQLGDLVLERLDRAGDVGLEDEVELLELALLDVLKTSSSETLRPERRASASVFRRCARSCASCAGAAVVLDDADVLAGLGDAVEAEHLDRVAGQRLLDARAGVVVHRADAAPVGAGDERVADLQRAALDEQRHDRAAARVELGLDDDAGRRRVRVGLELLDLGHDVQRLEQVVEAVLGLGGDVDELGLAAPLDRLQAARGHLGAHAGRVGALLVDLVDRDDDRDVGGLRVVDRLVGLRLHAVVGGDDDDRDVGHAGAAGAHGGERLVAGRVEEGDELARRGGPGRRRCAA